MKILKLKKVNLTYNFENRFRVWDLSNGTELHNGRHWSRSSDITYAKCPSTVLVEPQDGALFALLCEEKIIILNRDGFTIFHEIECPGPTCMAWSPDGKFLAVGNKNGKVTIYNSRNWNKGPVLKF